MTRVGIFGWGVVAPRSPNIDAFAANLEEAGSWLEPFDGFGPDSFLVGNPEFRFADYRQWIVDRFKPNRFSQLENKMGAPIQYAIGSFIQALEQNPGLESVLQELGHETHVYVGTGLGDLETQYQQSVALFRAQRRWNSFWADPERNSALAEYLRQGGSGKTLDEQQIPPVPTSVAESDRAEATELWNDFWAARSPELQQCLEELREIESVAVEGDVESGKIAAIKGKQRSLRRLWKKWGAPEPPWQSVSANLIWNIDNIAASQISMLGRIVGPAVAPSAACSTFGVTLDLALQAIRSGRARAAVIGATDPPPHPLTVGAFYSARVISADGRVSKPLTELRGTHVAGGAAIWIVGDMDFMKSRGFEPLGMEPVAVGVTSDADHIITPSKEGPSAAMCAALESGGIAKDQVCEWDMHATATPGDFNEVEMVSDVLSDDVLVTARKGTFGHGMAASGGWELTAQYLGAERELVFPTALTSAELNPLIGDVHQNFAFDARLDAKGGASGKLSMGIGGINASVVSRPLERTTKDSSSS